MAIGGLPSERIMTMNANLTESTKREWASGNHGGYRICNDLRGEPIMDKLKGKRKSKSRQECLKGFSRDHHFKECSCSIAAQN